MACLECQRTREEGLSCAGDADKERVNPSLEKREIVEAEIAGSHLLATGREVEVEPVNGVDLGELGIGNSALDGRAGATLSFFVGEAIQDVGGREIFFRCLCEQGLH